MKRKRRVTIFRKAGEASLGKRCGCLPKGLMIWATKARRTGGDKGASAASIYSR